MMILRRRMLLMVMGKRILRKAMKGIDIAEDCVFRG